MISELIRFDEALPLTEKTKRMSKNLCLGTDLNLLFCRQLMFGLFGIDTEQFVPVRIKMFFYCEKYLSGR